MNLARALEESNPKLAAFVAEILIENDDGSLGAEPLDPKYWAEALLDPATDILSRPGKGFRSRLVEIGWRLAGGRAGELPEGLPLLIELLHAGSLVIDDIEDDSPERRGQPTLHRRYGVPVALNTGNWLTFLPLVLLTRLGLGERLTLALHTDITTCVVLCHQGQALDLSARVTLIRQSEMSALVARTTRLKTGALTRLAVMLGARTAGCEAERLAALSRFGTELGIGLQMLDDWSGIANDERRHKGVEDIRLGRPTWPWAWLADDCDEVSYATLVAEARRVSIEWEAEQLIPRLRSQLRDTAVARIHAFLQSAFVDLESGMRGESSDIAPRGEKASPAAVGALEELREEIERLERAYG